MDIEGGFQTSVTVVIFWGVYQESRNLEITVKERKRKKTVRSQGEGRKCPTKKGEAKEVFQHQQLFQFIQVTVGISEFHQTSRLGIVPYNTSCSVQRLTEYQQRLTIHDRFYLLSLPRYRREAEGLICNTEIICRILAPIIKESKHYTRTTDSKEQHIFQNGKSCCCLKSSV